MYTGINLTGIKNNLSLLKRVFVYTLIFGLSAHAYMYFSLAPSHDSLHTLLCDEGIAQLKIATSRFACSLYYHIRGSIPAPWLVGIMSILFFTASNYLVVRSFNIKKCLSIVLLCGIFVTNLTVVATLATYMLEADVYSLALLLACLSAYLWVRFPKFGFILAIFPLSLCLGLYQAYVDVAIGLALILLIKKIAEGESFSAFFQQAVRYALSLIGGALLYFALVKFTQHFTGIEMADAYNSLNVFLNNSFSSLLHLLPGAYLDFIKFFLSPQYAHNTSFVVACRVLIAVASVIIWLRHIFRQHIRGMELIALLLCVALLPLGLNFIYILSAGTIHGQLITFSFFLVYPLSLLPLEWGENTPPEGFHPIVLCRLAVLFFCGCMVFRNIVFANGAYFYKQILFEASSQYAFSITEDIESTPDYEPGHTQVAFVGEFPASSVSRQGYNGFEEYSDLTGMGLTSLTGIGPFTGYSYSILGHTINRIWDADQMEEIGTWPEVQRMPVFPHDGYCRIIDGIMVVKLSD